MKNKHRQTDLCWALSFMVLSSPWRYSFWLSWYASFSSWSNLLAFSILRSRSRIYCILRTYTWLGVGVGVGRILLTLYTFKSKTRRDKISHVSNSNNNKTTTQQNTFGNRRWSLLSYTWSQITLCEEGTAYVPYCSVLAGHGALFPAGSSTAWQPERSQTGGAGKWDFWVWCAYDGWDGQQCCLQSMNLSCVHVE